MRAKIQSRHSNKTKYSVYVMYDTKDSSVDSLKGWLCSCKSGKRTVGCCSHIATIVYYLSFGKYNQQQERMAGNLSVIFRSFDLVESDEDDFEEDEDEIDYEFDN